MNTYELNAWIAEHVMGGVDCTYMRPLVTGTGHVVENLPFTTDLNATAQAEAKIAEMEPHISMQYAGQLRHMLPRASLFGLITATARQRCEAMYAIRERIAKAALTKEHP